MKRSFFLLCLLSLGLNAVSQDSKKPLNIIFLLVDDMGYADIGSFGSKFYDTPNVDALATGGMKFTNSYTAASICSPTRASIITGKYPVRTGVTDWIPGQKVSNTKLKQPKTKLYLDTTEVSFAQILKDNGYATFYAGKWHLGEKENFNPLTRGFDEYYSGKHLRVIKSKFTTDSITAHTLDFINRKAKSGKPFIAYVSYYDVHTPIYEYPEFIDHYKRKSEDSGFSIPADFLKEGEAKTRTRQDDPGYGSLVSAVDKSVGDIVKLIRRLDIEENTVIIFTSDNGGLSTTRNIGPTSNLPYRAGKGWLYEGGIKVPMVISAPGRVSPGSSTSEITLSTDLYPTFLDLANINPPGQRLDGVSLVPLIMKGTSLPERDLFWHYPHYHGSTWTPGAAIRSGDWKLIVFYENHKLELYNLRTDPYEKKDLSFTNPEIVRSLRAKLEKWQAESGALMPVLNEDYDPKAKAISPGEDSDS